MAVVVLLNYFVSKVLSHAYATFLSLALGPEPSVVPLEWPGKVLSYSVRASGAQPGCLGLPESLSIRLNA